MSDETPPEATTSEPTGKPFPSPKHCFDTWDANRGLGFRELAKILQEEGYRCSPQWLQRVKDGHKPWLEAYTVFRTENISPERILSALAIATKSAKEITPEALMGVKARLVAKLFESIDKLDLTDVDKFEQLLDCAPKIDAMIHYHRGNSIVEGKGSGVPETGKKGSIIAAFAPKPQIAAVKPPNGGAH